MPDVAANMASLRCNPRVLSCIMVNDLCGSFHSIDVSDLGVFVVLPPWVPLVHLAYPAEVTTLAPPGPGPDPEGQAIPSTGDTTSAGVCPCTAGRGLPIPRPVATKAGRGEMEQGYLV